MSKNDTNLITSAGAVPCLFFTWIPLFQDLFFVQTGVRGFPLSSYVNCLTPIPEEWLVERDWLIVNHWEAQFCRDVYQDLCEFAEFQHLRAVALLSPRTTPRVCPVDNLMNTHPSLPFRDQMTLETLDPCAWRYVLTMDDLASFRLSTRLMSLEHGRLLPLHTITSTAR